jgi:hypothetical protein
MSALGNLNLKNENLNDKSPGRPMKRTKGEIGKFNRGVYFWMQRKYKLSDAILVRMKEATCPAKINGMAGDLIRYFNPDTAKERGITVEDYEILNEYPELILYEGYYVPGRKGEINIKKWEGAATSSLEEKINNGTITDVGIVIAKTAAQKWLSRIGNFMIMGGFMLVLILIAGLAIAISILAKNC